MFLISKFFEHRFEIYRVMERLAIHRKLGIVDSDPTGNLLMQDRVTISVRCYIIQEVGGNDGVPARRAFARGENT
jgi:hypothetical protein